MYIIISLHVFQPQIIAFLFLSALRTLNLLIKRSKIGQFQKTHSVLESSFYGLSDGNFKFDLSKQMKILFEKNCLKNGKKISFLPIFRVKIAIIPKTVGQLKRTFLDLPYAVFRIKKFLLVKEILRKNYKKYILRSQSQLPG